MYMYMYSSPHKNVPTTLEYYVGSRLEVASILYNAPTAYYAAYRQRTTLRIYAA